LGLVDQWRFFPVATQSRRPPTVALPAASPAIYLTSSLAVTFPFNVVVGIPLYFSFARWIAA
jgi:hypothetical protein